MAKVNLQGFADVTSTTKGQSFAAAPPPRESVKFDTTTPAKEPVRRFTMGDLTVFADRLYPALKQQFPHINDRMYGGWLRSCMDSNQFFFVCNDISVGLAQVVNAPLDPRPIVEVVFILEKGSRVEILKAMVDWARNQNAEFRASSFGDQRQFDPFLITEVELQESLGGSKMGITRRVQHVVKCV